MQFPRSSFGSRNQIVDILRFSTLYTVAPSGNCMRIFWHDTWWGARSGSEVTFWIGTALLDSLFSYPEGNNLSRSSFPIHLLMPDCSCGPQASDTVGDLHYTKPSDGASPACRTLMWCNSPITHTKKPRPRAIDEAAAPSSNHAQTRRYVQP